MKKTIIKNKKRLVKELPGLTLIELLVSIGIITLVSSAFILNYRGSTHRSDLAMATQMVVADIYQAQNNALGLLDYGESSPAGGWGVHFDLSKPDEYYIFADMQSKGNEGHGIFYETLEGVEALGARKILLPKNIKLAGIRTSLEGVNYNLFNIVFIPPDPRVTINLDNVSQDFEDAKEIYLYLKEVTSEGDGDHKIIKVNILGLIEVIQ